MTMHFVYIYLSDVSAIIRTSVSNIDLVTISVLPLPVPAPAVGPIDGVCIHASPARNFTLRLLPPAYEYDDDDNRCDGYKPE